MAMFRCLSKAAAMTASQTAGPISVAPKACRHHNAIHKPRLCVANENAASETPVKTKPGKINQRAL